MSRNVNFDQIDRFNNEDEAYDSIFRTQYSDEEDLAPLTVRTQDPAEERKCNKKMICIVGGLCALSLIAMKGDRVGSFWKGNEGPVYESNLQPYGGELIDENGYHAGFGDEIPVDTSMNQDEEDSIIVTEQEFIDGEEEGDDGEEEADKDNKDKVFSDNTSDQDSDGEHMTAAGIPEGIIVEDMGVNFEAPLDGEESLPLDKHVSEDNENTGDLFGASDYTIVEEVDNETADIKDEESGKEITKSPQSSEYDEQFQKEKEQSTHPEYIVDKKQDLLSLDSSTFDPWGDNLEEKPVKPTQDKNFYDPFHKNKKKKTPPPKPTQPEEEEFQDTETTAYSNNHEGSNDKYTLKPTKDDVVPEKETVLEPTGPISPLKYKFADLDKPFVPGIDVPFFWYIPRTAATSLENILAKCHHLVAAGNKGAIGGTATAPFLQVFEPYPGEKYVNVELRTKAGIQRAINLDVVGSGLVDFVVASRIYEVREIFHPPRNQGRCFALMRHPIERAVSLFYYLKDASHENSFNEEISKMSIEQYVTSDKVESNWMIRSIVGKLEGGTVTIDDVNEAKQFLEKKCIIGLSSEYSESYHRFEKYFELGISKENGCENQVMASFAAQAQSHPKIVENSPVWNDLAGRNNLDISLFEFAVELFKKQKRMFQ